MRRGNLSMSRPKCRRGRPARRRVSCCAQGLGKDQRDEIHPDAFRRAIKTPVPPCVCGASLRARGGRTRRPCASERATRGNQLGPETSPRAQASTPGPFTGESTQRTEPVEQVPGQSRGW